MQAQGSGALLIKRPFDLQEAVLLLDVYLSMVKNGVPIMKAAEKASVRLRSLAKNKDYEVSDSYRSAVGLVNRLRSLRGLYEGQESKSAPGTAMFAEAVSLYKNDRTRYEEILNTAKETLQDAICDVSVAGAKTKEIKPLQAKKEGEMSITSGYGIPIEKSEAFLLSVGLSGATAKEIITAVQPNAAVSSTIAALESSMNVITMPNNRYVHVDSFVDLDEAEEAMSQILRTHFGQFEGYSNNQLLFGAASQELSMFLNDNDCENIDAVYAIARFLFEKKAAAGAPYKFFTPHIFEKEPDYPMTLRGLMIHLARNNGGLLYASDAKDYLQKTMLTYGGISQLLQLGSSNTFLIYDSGRYLLSESLGIDDAWCMRMHDRLDDLFRKANVAYVIPRDISTAWLTTLPLLPHGLDWTRLLLQEVLDKYPAIGFKSISPDLTQTHDTLAAAFVPMDSPLQTFPDVVILFMEQHHDLPMRISGEDLRLELRAAGMLENGEMIYALPKALNDYRFAWSNENKTVYVRGNK